MLAAITGIAAADHLQVYHQGTTTQVSSVQLTPGADFTRFDLCVSEFLNDAGTQHKLTTTITPGAGGGSVSDIQVEYKESGEPQAQGPYMWGQDAGKDGSDTLELYISATAAAPVDAQYSVTIMDTVSGSSYIFSLDAATISVTTVPEFATIALPVGAILGLLFFFNHRKRRKE